MQQKDSNTDRHAARRIALHRRSVLAGGAAALAQFAAPGNAARAATVVPQGKLTLAWHTNIAPRWLDPQKSRWHGEPRQFPDGAARRPHQELPR